MGVKIPSYLDKSVGVPFIFMNEKLPGDFFMRLVSNIAINFVVYILIFYVYFERE